MNNAGIIYNDSRFLRDLIKYNFSIVDHSDPQTLWSGRIVEV